MSRTYAAGIATSYGAAKKAGYTGTYDEWCQDLAALGTTAAQVSADRAVVEEARDTVVTKAEQAAESASSASADALRAEGYAVGRQNGEPVASGSTYYHSNAAYYAGQAEAAQDAAETAQGAAEAAQGAAEAAQDAAETAQAAAEAALAAIPPDYTALSDAVAKSLRPGKIYTTSAGFLADVPSGTLGELPVNQVFCIGGEVVNAADEPMPNFVGTVMTLSYTNELKPGDVQLAYDRSGAFFYRYYQYRAASSGGNYWKGWVRAATDAELSAAVGTLNTGLANCLSGGKQYLSSSDFLADVPSGLLGDLPVNQVFNIGADSVNAADEPTPNFVGNVMTLSFTHELRAGDVQLAYDRRQVFYYRYYQFRSAASGGNYWKPWVAAATRDDVYGETYHVGGTSGNTFIDLLISLRDDTNPKTIYVHPGEYDLFAEYTAAAAAGKLTPAAEIPDDISASDYFYPLNAFVPHNTRIVGLGRVVFSFEPDADEISYGASRTWSPLNLCGNCEIENITVKAHNCRYALHNDDHNLYTGITQHFKHCRFLYRLGDVNASDQRLGFNNTVGFGINTDSTHIFDDCEIYFEGAGNYSAYYGHENSLGDANGLLLLRNCTIRSSDPTSNRVLRLQSLNRSGTQKHVRAIFENCYLNGGLALSMYYADSPQNYEVTFRSCNKLPVRRTIPSGGTIVDPFTVTWFNPLPTPTAQTPLIETDAYAGGAA